MGRRHQSKNGGTRARKRTVFRSLLRLGLVLSLWGFAGLAVIIGWCAWDLPSVSQIKPFEVQHSITILAADGTLIARYGGLKGDSVTVSQLPPYVSAAVLSIEDRRFYDHFGIDPLGLARAIYTNLKARRWVQGGSTITQQLAKNLFLTPDKTLRRKIQEAMLALWIEHRFTKEEILSAYLNRVYFGSGAYGIDAAAKTYFGKPATDITLWESAVLAGLLKAPSKYSPSSNPKLARDRAKTVIAKMEEAGYIDKGMKKQELDEARIRLAGAAAGDLNRYFADWVTEQIDSYITDAGRDLVVRTTFVPQLQLLAETREKALFKQLKPEQKISQAALVTMGPDGAVLAMIGGVDYEASQFNRATQAQRQPGSAFKPFVYLAALEAGYDPENKLLDAPITSGPYKPHNYDDRYFGEVTLTEALARSLNTATVRLLQDVGIAALIDVAQRFNFPHPFAPELATGLGADETTLLDMTNAYAMIANGGYSIWPYAVLSIEDSEGNVLYEHEDVTHARMFSGRDIAALDGMLVQVVAQGTGQAAQLSRGHVAGKTGTSQNYRDAWFIGYTNRFITGIWMGNDDDSAMEKVSGGKYPARLWHDYMEQAINVDVPSYARRMPHGGDDGFSRMIRRWSSGDFGGFSGSDVPVYNQ
ncbi:MAG: PBP1A family penicillin-binding protein [Alphaproteobacteria bacterium]|nr:MAG: PBP1A family penicillin-binding protein [Alphaproteobacteria bacterium]